MLVRNKQLLSHVISKRWFKRNGFICFSLRASCWNGVVSFF